jgi:hypothetical protein
MKEQAECSADDLLDPILTQLGGLKTLLSRESELILNVARLLKSGRRTVSGEREAVRRPSMMGRGSGLEDVW